MLSKKPLTLLHEDRESSNEQLEAERFMAINQQSFAELLTFIEFADDFTIGFVEINYTKDTDYLIVSLEDHPDCQDIQFLICIFDEPNLRFLRDEIIKELSKITIELNKKLVIIIRGLENAIGSSGYYPPILQDLNYVRDAFTKSVPHPILFCLPDYAITRLARFAPDFWAWRSGLFTFITFYDFKSTQEWIIPKTLQFYITLQTLYSTLIKERIELLNELLNEYAVSSIKTKQDIQNYLNILTQLAVAYRRNKKTLLQAEEYLKQAYELVENYGSSISISIQANVIYELGVTYIEIGDLVSALAYLQNSLELRKNISDFQGTAETLYQLGIIHAKQRKLEEALSYFHESLKIQENINNNLGKAETLNQMGILHVDRGDIEAAIYYYQDALSIYNRETFPERWGVILNNLAIAYGHRIHGDKAENLEKEIAYYIEVLQVYTRQAFPEQWATVQNNLANAYSDRILGNRAENLELAIISYHNALQVYTREAFPEQWAETNNNLAVVYSYRIYGDRSENLEQAIACYQNSWQIYKQETCPEKWAVIQNNLAVAYRQRILGDHSENLEQAITCYQNALEVYTREEFPEQWAIAQNNLANAYSKRIRGNESENLEKAIAFYQKALQVCTLESFPEQWASIQNNLAVAYRNRINGEKAESLEIAIICYENALQVYILETFPTRWAMAQNNLASAYTNRIHGDRSENLDKAITYYKQALQVYTRTTFPLDYAKTQFNIAIAYQTLGRFHNAYSTLKLAIDTVEFLRGEIVSGEQAKQKLSEEWIKLYQCMVEVCLKLASTEPNRYPEAIEYVERSKTRNLVEILANRDLYPKGDIPKLVIEKLNRLRREIALEQRLLRSAAQNILDDSFPMGNFTRFYRLREELDDLIRSEIQPIDPTFKTIQTVNPICFDEMQALLDDRSVILEWYIIDECFLTFTITRQHPGIQVWRSTPEDLQALVNLSSDYLQEYIQHQQQWREKLPDRLKTLAKILHLDQIIEPLLNIYDQVILIPHRYLHLLPLHALTLSNGSYLLELFSRGVRYAPSCQLLQLISKQHQPDFSSFFAIQNPTQDLSFTDIEVETIRQMFPSSDVLAKEVATKAAFVTYPLHSVNCLHLSCHGYFNLNSPLQSGLVLADSVRKTAVLEITDTQRSISELRSSLRAANKMINLDNCLTLGEIFGLELNQCRLVTLSACETGLTDISSTSDEYISLASGFLFAGSPSIVGGLWMVDDFVTALLMIKFYENLQNLPKLETGDVAISLNQAQLWLRTITTKELQIWIKEKLFPAPAPTLRMYLRRMLYKMPDDAQPFNNPYYWAAFTAVGV